MLIIYQDSLENDNSVMGRDSQVNLRRMGKEMRPDELWQKARQCFEEAVGLTRIIVDDLGIRVRFNMKRPDEMEQATLFGYKAGEGRIKFFAIPGKHDEESMPVDMFIPREGNEPIAVLELAYAMARDAEVIRMPKDNGEMHRPIVSTDPQYPLTSLTGTDWMLVNGSPYDTEIVEAVLPAEKITGKERNQRIYGLGVALLPDNGSTILEVRNWLDEQESVERRTGEPPRTALPSGWVTPDSVNRAASLTPTAANALKNTFC